MFIIYNTLKCPKHYGALKLRTRFKKLYNVYIVKPEYITIPFNKS